MGTYPKIERLDPGSHFLLIIRKNVEGGVSFRKNPDRVVKLEAKLSVLSSPSFLRFQFEDTNATTG